MSHVLVGSTGRDSFSRALLKVYYRCSLCEQTHGIVILADYSRFLRVCIRVRCDGDRASHLDASKQ